MSAFAAPVAAVVFATAGTAAIGIIGESLSREWSRIIDALNGFPVLPAQPLYNEKAPIDVVSTGAPSLRLIAGRRLAKDARSFPSQARRGVFHSTNRRSVETGL